jgi:hypothetical protein
MLVLVFELVPTLWPFLIEKLRLERRYDEEKMVNSHNEGSIDGRVSRLR